MTVTIIGAGIVGCAIAYELASHGVAVRVVDTRGVGKGATQASAGILAPRIEGHSEALLRLCVCGLGMYDAFVARVCADSSADIEYERNGTLQIAFEATEAAALAVVSARLSASAVAHTLLEGPDAVRIEPALSERTAAALLVPEHGYVSAPGLISALARAASNRGAAFVAARVEAVRDSVAGAQVVTTNDVIESDAAIIAAGSWSSAISVGTIHPVPVKPIRGQLLRLRTRDRIASRVIWGTRCYIVPWRDGSVLVGATVEDVGFDETSTAGGVRGLLDAAVELLPALEHATFEEVRVGLRPMISDELPVIGASSTMPHVFYATGHYRNGVLLAPLTASLIADLVLEGRERAELAWTRPDRVGL